jgi:hypothetical protein
MNATELRIPFIPIPLPATMDDADLIPCACVLVYGDTAALDGRFAPEIREYLKTSVTPWLRDLVEKFKC